MIGVGILGIATYITKILGMIHCGGCLGMWPGSEFHPINLKWWNLNLDHTVMSLKVCLVPPCSIHGMKGT